MWEMLWPCAETFSLVGRLARKIRSLENVTGEAASMLVIRSELGKDVIFLLPKLHVPE